MNGAELIAKERRRQVSREGWTAEHDDEHTRGELASAAICYASPERVFVQGSTLNGVAFVDPWPWSRGGRGEPSEGYDKRFEYGERRDNPGNVVPDPVTYTTKERIDLLVKAGALIAAEIDRLKRT